MVASIDIDYNTQYNGADIAFVALGGCLVFLMIPGVGLFYAGLARKQHALSLVWASMAGMSLIAFQWFFWGYSFVFSLEGGKFWGDVHHFGGLDIDVTPSVAAAAVPEIVFMFFQGMFACITGVIMLGGAHERARLAPMMVFLFIWITVVYCPIAEWTWNPNGWLAQLGALDFAGGGPVHMASGFGGLAYALVCGKRRDPAATALPVYKPGSVLLCVFGTVFLWFGWFGFNGMSAGAANIRAIYAMANTNLAAAVGGLAWMLVDYAKHRKWSTIGVCSGIIAGLVGITPCAGMVPLWAAFVVGLVTGIVCNLASHIKHWIRIDDGLDVFALHGIGGLTGSILTALFTADYITHLDGATLAQGWLNHHYVQLPYQLAAIGATIGWSFVITTIILVIMNYIPYMHLRMSEEDEQKGSDLAQLQEHGMFGEGDNLRSVGTILRGEEYPTEDAYRHNKESADASSGEAPSGEAQA